MSPTPLLRFEGIRFAYPNAAMAVLRDFNLDIEAGTVTAILGPNGAGKTTLLHMGLGWLKPQAGVIRLDGQPLGQYSRRELGQWLGLVPQSEHISFDYSLQEFALLGRAPHLSALEMPGETDQQLAAAALEQVGMGTLRDRSMLALSGGERQLVLVARALAQQPRLLLLDEPTTHLDLGNKSRLVRLLGELSARGVTVLFSTHEPEVAAALATHLVLMRAGQVLKTGTLDETFTTETLSELYQLPVQVGELAGKRVAVWS